MSAIILMLLGLGGMALGFFVYSKFLALVVFKLSDKFRTPAHEFEDGVDFVPTNKFVLWGHHFTSVAGAAPIVGPAIAVIWGWLPAFLWVVIVTIVAGAVHDFGALWISVKHKGNSVGTLAEGIVGSRARVLFLMIIFFLLLLVNAVFPVIYANLFIGTPSSVIPVWSTLALAMIIRDLIYKRGVPILVPSRVALALIYVMIYVGQFVEFQLPSFIPFSPSEAQIAAAG